LGKKGNGAEWQMIIGDSSMQYFGYFEPVLHGEIYLRNMGTGTALLNGLGAGLREVYGKTSLKSLLTIQIMSGL